MKKYISTEKAPKAVGAYSQAVEANSTLYISGQIGINPETGLVVEGGIKAQTRRIMENIGGILEEAGLDYSNVVKSRCILHRMEDFKEMNEVYSEFYKENPPARAALGGVELPLGVLVEIETIAVRT